MMKLMTNDQLEIKKDNYASVPFIPKLYNISTDLIPN